MDVSAINETILRHQLKQLTEAAALEALAAAEHSRDRTLEGRRLAAACSLSDAWAMTVCVEVARALIPGPSVIAEAHGALA